MYIKHFLLAVIFYGVWISSTEVDAAPPRACASQKDPTAYCEKQCYDDYGFTFPTACCIETFLSGFTPLSTCVCCPGDTCYVPYAKKLVCIDGDAPICQCGADDDNFVSYLQDKCKPDVRKCSSYYRT